MKKLFLSLTLGFTFLFLFSQLASARNANALSHIPVCPGPGSVESARCHARVVTDGQGNPSAAVIPKGYGPAQFRGAYGVGGTVNTPTTIAIIDAYDDPNILSDLNTYSTTFGLPTMKSCAVSAGTTSTPCFQKVNQNGGTSYPRTDAGWSLEIALDVEAAHAMCQNCNILLVEGTTNSFANLMTAVDRARTMGAKIISNSYGASEFSGETAYDTHFSDPTVAFTVSSGDNGYGVEYPAASQYVTAVGGTTLQVTPTNTYGSESAWSGAGSGCSAYETKPSWQHDSGCARRTVADVSADADPNTGAAVYSSVNYQGRKGWFQVGGTSLAAPLIAGVYAQGTTTTTGPANSWPYNNTSWLRDIVTGNNGTCSGSYLCTALSAYDGPTGLGSPNGTNAF